MVRVHGIDGRTDLVCVIKVKEPAARLVHALVACICTAHRQGREHVDVVAGKVEGDQTLEDDCPSGEGGRQENTERGSGTSIGHHIHDGAEACRLFEVPRRIAVEGIKEAGDAIEGATSPWVVRHVVEGYNSEDNSEVALDSEQER